MDLMNLLSQVLSAGQVEDHHFDQVTQRAPQDVLSSALAEAFRSNETPPIGDMVAQLFGNSNPQQKSDLVNRLLAVAGPAVMAALANGSLGRILGGLGLGGQQAQEPYQQQPAYQQQQPTYAGNYAQDYATSHTRGLPQLTPQQVEQLDPNELRDVINQAQQQDPSVADKLGDFYSQHSGLIKGLGGAALLFTLAKMRERMEG